MKRLDISTPELLRYAVSRAMNNKRENRRLLVALGACRYGRAKYANQTLSEAWHARKTDASDLYWLISRLRDRLYPGATYKEKFGVLGRLDVMASQIYPNNSRLVQKTRAKLYRAWFKPTGEMRLGWEL